MVRIFTVIIFLTVAVPLFAVSPVQKNLPIGFAPFEPVRAIDAEPMSAPPSGPVRSLGEWESSSGAMTLWPNASLVNALQKRGPVKLLADQRSDVGWWQDWLQHNGISDSGVSYFEVPTDSIWIRDYGPWGILDGNAEFGWVHNTYNRPRPQDNRVAAFIAKATQFPLYVTGLVHTGGNYYSDGLHNAFSSTLVFSENAKLTSQEILTRMYDFLGIENYTTSRLSPGNTIQHLDTFGKLVAPDTWVFGEFPEGAPYKADSDNMVKKLRTLTSPYGTPYKIFRIKMTRKPGGGDYRAYINSFISNGALYFPTYGGVPDEDAKRVYQAALPGYDIVGVGAEDTSWGDSVHCRTRNLPLVQTVFIFPTTKVIDSAEGKSIEVKAEIVASPGQHIIANPILHWKKDGNEQPAMAMERRVGRQYGVKLPTLEPGTKVSLYLEAQDTANVRKMAPILAPAMTIDIEVK